MAARSGPKRNWIRELRSSSRSRHRALTNIQKEIMTSHAMAILLVEDDPRDARTTVRERQRGSITPQIDVVQDVEEALYYLFCRGAHSELPAHHPPQLNLLDLKLPKVDGFQVVRE